MSAPLRRTLPLLLALLLSACGGDMSDLHRYVAQVKARKVTHVPPVPQIKPYTPFAYVAGDRRDPFMPQDTLQNEPTGSANDKGLHPDLSRNKEPLEEYPLDALHMVGTIDFKGRDYAMIKAPDGVIHRVTVGDHMGQNYGKVIKVTAGAVDLSEIIPDGFGGWQQRAASISLAQ